MTRDLPAVPYFPPNAGSQAHSDPTLPVGRDLRQVAMPVGIGIAFKQKRRHVLVSKEREGQNQVHTP